MFASAKFVLYIALATANYQLVEIKAPGSRSNFASKILALADLLRLLVIFPDEIVGRKICVKALSQ